MRYSLYSRFQGVLVGAVIGEIAGIQQIHASVTTQPQLQLGKLLAGSLLQHGRFDQAEWQRIWHNYYAQTQPTADKVQICCGSVDLEIFTATLLVALFYHDNEIKLRQNLLLALTVAEQDTSANRDYALAIGYAIAQSLQERLQPDAKQLIPRTIAFIGEPQSQLAQQLAQVEIMLEQGAGLDRTTTQLKATTLGCSPTALAFYCYLSTIEDFRISVRRAALGEPTTICSAITGALSGAYNSIAGIPATWRLRPHYNRPLATWGMTTAAEMLELADSLALVWSGVYDQIAYQTEPMPVAAIAAPAVIRSR